MAGRIPQNFINDLIARADIVALIDERVNLRKAGKNYQGLCPFHDEKTPSFSVSPDKQFYHCFGCGANGTALSFLMEYDRLEFVPAVEALAARVGVEVQREGGGGPVRPAPGADLYALLERASTEFQRRLRTQESAVGYLKQRGLTGITARDFGLGYAPDAWDTMQQALPGESSDKLLRAGLLSENDRGRRYDRFRDRIMFPIRDTRGRVIGFGGRVLGSGEPKYLNSPETDVFHKGQELYGLFEARQALRTIDEFFVVEGYMDVIALAQAGVANAVATLGTASSVAHFDKLYRYVPRVTCCFDGDNAGRQAAWKALETALPTLRDGRQLRFMFLPDGEDPDSLVRREGRDGFLRRAAAGVSALDYLFDTLRDGLDLGSPDGRARLAHLAQPFIDSVPEGLLRDLLGERLIEVVGQSAVRTLAAGGGSSVNKSALRSAPVESTPSVAKLSPLLEKLLVRLLHYPALARELSPQMLATVGTEASGILSQVIDYVRGNDDPELGLADILGYWAGRPEANLLADLGRRSVALPEAAADEFAEGLNSLAKQRSARLAAQERRELLRQLGEPRQTPPVGKIDA